MLQLKNFEKENLSWTFTQKIELMNLVVPTKTIQIVDIPDKESKDTNTTLNLKETQTSQPVESVVTSKQQKTIYRNSNLVRWLKVTFIKNG